MKKMNLFALMVLVFVSAIFTGCTSIIRYDETVRPDGTRIIKDRSQHYLQPGAGVAVPFESHGFFRAAVGGTSFVPAGGYGYDNYGGGQYGYGGGVYTGTIIVPIESQGHYMRETSRAYGFDGGGNHGGHQGGSHQGGGVHNNLTVSGPYTSGPHGR